MNKLILYALLGLSVLLFTGCEMAESKPQKEKKWLIEDSVIIEGVDFVDMSSDTIVDPSGSMRSFYIKLIERDGNGITPDQGKINIVHYGDSHIQAGIMTGVTMRRLQNRFGNAGRGLILPQRLTHSNEPRDYKITSPNSFTKTRLLDVKPETTIGIGGLGIKSVATQQQFNISTLQSPGDTLDYSFNRVIVFHDSHAPIITARESEIAAGDQRDDDTDFITDIHLLHKTDSVMLYTYPCAQFNNGAFYGFSLENGNPGVLYHSIGINGSCYLHWGRASEVIKQSVILEPDLIIISLGANEASGRNFIDDVFYREIDSFVSRLRAINPQTAILLTIAPEAMKKTKRTAMPNPNYERVRRTIIRYGADKDVAILDLYGASGGSNSSKKWDSAGLFQRDKIHFTTEGYNIQGLMIYGAILDGFKKIKTQTQKGKQE